MAGGAEIINWAQAILSLRPAETEGNSTSSAKRGQRVRRWPKKTRRAWAYLGADHGNSASAQQGRLEIEGVARSIPVIFWEAREPKAPDPEAEPTQSSAAADRRNTFSRPSAR